MVSTPEKPASRTCALAGSPEYRDGPEAHFGTTRPQSGFAEACCLTTHSDAAALFLDGIEQALLVRTIAVARHTLQIDEKHQGP